MSFHLTKISGKALVLGIMAFMPLLEGCSFFDTQRPDVAIAPSRADDILARAAAISARANYAVAQTEVQVANPKAAGPSPTFRNGAQVPRELAQNVSVDWDGPLEALLQSVTIRTGYRMDVKGHQPAAPVSVTMHRRNVPAWTIIRDAGTLVTDRATVVIDTSRRSVEVRYVQ